MTARDPLPQFVEANSLALDRLPMARIDALLAEAVAGKWCDPLPDHPKPAKLDKARRIRRAVERFWDARADVIAEALKAKARPAAASPQPRTPSGGRYSAGRPRPIDSGGIALAIFAAWPAGHLFGPDCACPACSAGKGSPTL